MKSPRVSDEDLLAGKWTGKGIDDYPLEEELIRMINLLARKSLAKK